MKQDPIARRSAEVELPHGFVERMERLLGGQIEPFLSALRAPVAGLRVNTLRATPAAFEAMAPFHVWRLPFPEDGFGVDGDDRPGRHPYHAAGLYYLQDPGAIAVGALIDALPGERVIDVSAAPGGKATHMAAAMGNHGLLVANDIERPRAVELARNLERLGVRNAVVTSEPVDRLATHYGPVFDRVLVDAPCSGESMFHKSAAARAGWSQSAVLGCARRQSELIRISASLVRPGGLLVYSTCTFAPEENEAVIESFFEVASDFEPAPLSYVPGAERVAAGGRAAAYRLWPHRVPGAGHFIAAARRRDDSGDATQGERRRMVRPAARPTRDSLARLRALMRDAYSGAAIDEDRVVLVGQRLFELPEAYLPTGDLRTVSAGLAVGTERRGRVEPAHALALAIPPTLAADPVDLRMDDPRVRQYLEGHPIDIPGAPGWVPVTVDGFALGWGKRVGSTVKNHYPKGLRWQG